jgi:thymidylate kinase
MKIKNTQFICFEGMDGSGKSTLSHYLVMELQRKGYSVKYLRWFDGEDTIIKKLMRSVFRIFTNNKKKGSRTDDLKLNSSENQLNHGILLNCYVAILLINYLWYGISRVRITSFIKKSDYFIIDRYYFDTVLSIAREFGYSNLTLQRTISLFKTILPYPDLFIFINISPELAYERKPDEFSSIEKAKIIEEWHKNLFLLIEQHTDSSRIKFDNSQNFDVSRDELLSQVSPFLR